MENTQTKDNKEESKDIVIRKPYRDDVFKNFIEWSVMTRKEKRDKGMPTAKAFAQKHNIGEVQLSRWKKLPAFDDVKRRHLLDTMGDYTPEVLDALRRRCVKYGMANDVEFWLLYVEGWSKKAALEQVQVNKLVLDPQDIRALVNRLPKEKQNKFYDTLVDLIDEAKRAGVDEVVETV